MKILVVFLSLTIAFLNAVPCCWDTCSEDDAVVHAEESPASQDACSPFLSCGSCTGFVLQQELPEISSSVISAFRSSSMRENPIFSSDYSEIIWSPPKKV